MSLTLWYSECPDCSERGLFPHPDARHLCNAHVSSILSKPDSLPDEKYFSRTGAPVREIQDHLRIRVRPTERFSKECLIDIVCLHCDHITTDIMIRAVLRKWRGGFVCPNCSFVVRDGLLLAIARKWDEHMGW